MTEVKFHNDGTEYKLTPPTEADLAVAHEAYDRAYADARAAGARRGSRPTTPGCPPAPAPRAARATGTGGGTRYPLAIPARSSGPGSQGEVPTYKEMVNALIS
jgi:hypothetical protein